MATWMDGSQLTYQYVFGVWEETGVPRGNPCRHRENMQTPALVHTYAICDAFLRTLIHMTGIPGIMNPFEYIKILDEVMLPHAEEEMPLKSVSTRQRPQTHQ
ncbi:unnamed protein product [Staurois parvus]|uniref:Uncharacterized protein n=1 Tax=Staurois parvus TaxID=386267 RepID=A0ABN9DC91_9NEOB|nr:unnamed protein product [Staurois parvus]